MSEVRVGTLILGGGITGLWLLDQLRQNRQNALLIEPNSLGQGQTISSQGILHSGIKYSLQGLLTSSAREAREMPDKWRKCLLGESQPDLSRTEVVAQRFYLWGTDSAASRLGMLGARLGLQVTPQVIPREKAPHPIVGCQGSIYSVEEQVVSTHSLLTNLVELNYKNLAKARSTSDIHIHFSKPGVIHRVDLTLQDGQHVTIFADRYVFAAGKGNSSLRHQAGLPSEKQQLRPLHMVMLRGSLQEFYGHCIDGATTRVSITSCKAANEEVVWHVGGEVAEVGVEMDRASLISHARKELLDTMPGVHLDDAWWATYRIDRAEGMTMTGSRPQSFRVEEGGNTLTVWPTKLVLVPQACAKILEHLPGSNKGYPNTDFSHWPKPEVAKAPWDREQFWSSFERWQGFAA